MTTPELSFATSADRISALTGILLYLGSPSAHRQIAAHLELERHRFDLTLQKDLLWEQDG
jgi:hypothetical protein